MIRAVEAGLNISERTVLTAVFRDWYGSGSGSGEEYPAHPGQPAARRAARA
jgi:hypothetical protein